MFTFNYRYLIKTEYFEKLYKSIAKVFDFSEIIDSMSTVYMKEA